MFRRAQRILTTAQLRSVEAEWIKLCHKDWGMVLMERAGSEAAAIATAMWYQNPGRVVVVCGPGNNGGDGFVIARYLHREGIPVEVVSLEPRQPSGGERQINRALLEQLGIKITPADAASPGRWLGECSMVVDALLGTGIDRPVEGLYASLIDAINDSGKPVLSVDMPSGVNSDTGQNIGPAVRAWNTVTFGHVKAGLLSYPGAEFAGEITLVDIGLPDVDQLPAALRHLDAQLTSPRWWLATAESVRDQLPSRPPDSHKGTFGELIAVAGSAGMMGASLLASKSALKAGAGLCVLCTPRSLVASLPPSEVIYRGIAETDVLSISTEAIEALEQEMKRAVALMLGPGLSLNEETVRFVHRFIRGMTKRCVVDADGLNAIAADPSCIPAESEHLVLTPHPKEMSRLLNIPVREIQADRLATTREAAGLFGCTIVLKGARTVVAEPGGRAAIIPTGNPGMATAGSGDVLTGIIGALLAQGLNAFPAAVCGAYIHGAAGDLAAESIGTDGMTAGDIMAFVPVAIRQIRTGEFPGADVEQQVLASDWTYANGLVLAGNCMLSRR